MFALPPAPVEEPLRVLFIGNSYTYGNNLPAMVQRLSELTGGRKVVTEQVTNGGWTLQMHWLQGKAPGRLKEGKWDYVVLQDHSLRPIDDRPQFERFSRLFVHQIRQQGGKAVFYMTWARRHRPETQERLTTSYRRIAVEQKSLLAPVGEAWRSILTGPEPIRLHLGDDSHPNEPGTYIAAITILSAIRGQVVSPSPSEIPQIPDRLSNGKPRDLRLDPATAERLRLAAAGALERERRNR